MTIYINNQILNDLFEQPTTFEELQTILEQINENFTNINADALGKDDTYFTVKEVSASANLTRNVRPQYVKCSLTAGITLTLPTQNADGTHLKKNDTFFIIDSTRNSQTYNITVDLNGGEVDGDNSDIVIAKNGGFLWLRYSGWDAVNEVGTFEIVMSELLPNTLNNIIDETYVVGDILYASATDTLSKLAGNTATSKKFLRSQGNGTIASAPSWETISMSDLTAPTGTVSFNSQSISNVNNISGVSLTLSGDVAIDTNLFVIDSTANRIGILKADPAFPLDVNATSLFRDTLNMFAGAQIQSNVSSSNFIDVDNSGNFVQGSRSSMVFHIDYDNNQTDAVAKFRANNASDIWYIDELGSVTQDYTGTTGRALNLNADSITTDGILRLYSNSGDTSARYLLNIINDNTLATGAIPLRVQQDAVVSTNFKIVAEIAGKNIYVSDGTDPNGVLTGNSQGAICLNAGGSGQIKYYSTGTTWT